MVENTSFNNNFNNHNESFDHLIKSREEGKEEHDENENNIEAQQEERHDFEQEEAPNSEQKLNQEEEEEKAIDFIQNFSSKFKSQIYHTNYIYFRRRTFRIQFTRGKISVKE